MKKFLWAIIFFIVIGSFLSAGSDEQTEEIDFLLFLPDRSDLFVNPEQANIQLDNLAKYLAGGTFTRIYVYGYAAEVSNNVDPFGLSRDRALFVINELQNRGVPQNLFSDPVGYGSVDLWGNNSNEEDRIPNRRVRILADGILITPALAEQVIPEPQPAQTNNAGETSNTGGSSADYPEKKSPWWILLLLLIPLLAILFYLLSRRKKKAAAEEKPIIGPTSQPVEEPVNVPISPPLEEPTSPPLTSPSSSSEPVIVPAVVSGTIVDLEEEIRFCAYEFFLEHENLYRDPEGDWHRAVSQVCSRYEAEGFSTCIKEGRWQAYRYN